MIPSKAGSTSRPCHGGIHVIDAPPAAGTAPDACARSPSSWRRPPRRRRRRDPSGRSAPRRRCPARGRGCCRRTCSAPPGSRVLLDDLLALQARAAAARASTRLALLPVRHLDRRVAVGVAVDEPLEPEVDERRAVDDQLAGRHPEIAGRRGDRLAQYRQQHTARSPLVPSCHCLRRLHSSSPWWKWGRAFDRRCIPPRFVARRSTYCADIARLLAPCDSGRSVGLDAAPPLPPRAASSCAAEVPTSTGPQHLRSRCGSTPTASAGRRLRT